jgi:hypothetical protein
MPSILRDSKHWRERANEARALADKETDEQVRRSILTVAEEYEKIAVRADLRKN